MFCVDAQGLCCARYGQGFDLPIVLDDVRCVGTENSLGECAHRTFHNCGHSEDASVICQSGNVSCTFLMEKVVIYVVFCSCSLC